MDEKDRGSEVKVVDINSIHFGRIGILIDVYKNIFTVLFENDTLGNVIHVEFSNHQLEIYCAENIRHQSHYEQFKIQPVVFIAENNLDFLTGNIIKYVMRHGKKNGVEDLEKAKHYLDMLIQKVKGEEIKP